MMQRFSRAVDDAAVKANNEDIPESSITFMTLHNAKGLEFPVVFLVGLEENLIPHRSSLGSQAEIEEERRLLYVGITRAEAELYLLHAESRQQFGKTEYAKPSRFLEDISKDLLCEVDAFGRELNLQGLNKYARDLWRPPSLKADEGPNGLVKLRGGERVKHPKYGQGTVVGISGDGVASQVTVIFDGLGAKKLSLQYAQLAVI
ncbi:MAG: 3'-5' exonuclease [Deinococcales bacterium]